MSFRIALDKYERAYGAFVRAVQSALQATFAEEARDRGLTQNDIARELDLSPSVVSRKLNGSGNITLRSVSDLFTAMGREPLSGFHPPADRSDHSTMLVMGSPNTMTIIFVPTQNDMRLSPQVGGSINMFNAAGANPAVFQTGPTGSLLPVGSSVSGIGLERNFLLENIRP